MTIKRISATVYMLINCGWDNLGESYSETEQCLGIFTSKELATKAANDYLARLLNTVQDYEKEDYINPEAPITFEQLRDHYDFYNHTDYYGARLYIGVYELDKRKF